MNVPKIENIELYICACLPNRPYFMYMYFEVLHKILLLKWYVLLSFLFALVNNRAFAHLQ